MYCRKCGEKIDADSRFCEYCGTESINAKTDSSVAERPSEISKATVLTPAPQGKRFLNVLIDYIGLFTFGFFLGLLLDIIGLYFLIENMSDTLLGTLLLFAYYLLFETHWGKSPAKFITKTKVIKESGENPELKDIFVRTLCRFIPFEALTFLSNRPVGWHDRFSGTLVVDDS